MSRPSNSHRHKNQQAFVEVKAVTWNKDSHGLFDYENSYYDMRKFQISTPTILYRMNQEIHSLAKTAMEIENEETSESLLSVTKGDGTGSDKFYIEVNKENQGNARPNKQSFLIVRSLKCRDGRSQRGYVLNPGDIMKLGRVDFKIVEISTSKGCQRIDSHMDMMNQQGQIYDADEDRTYIDLKEKGEEVICKYCLHEKVPECDDALSNLLLYTCDCKTGVHFSCLKNWQQSRIVQKGTPKVTTYQWKKYECEICLLPWPKKVKFQGRINDLISLNRPATPYLIMEKVSIDPGTPSTMNIVVPIGQDPIKIGRGHLCDLRVSDISVSRIHTHIKFENDQFYVYDNDSKFGTLILLNNNYQVRSEKAAVQIGRTVFTFVLKHAPIDNHAHNAQQPQWGNNQ